VIEYRIKRTFDLEQDGMAGSDYVTLGCTTARCAAEAMVYHRQHARTVELEARSVGPWQWVETVSTLRVGKPLA
jgi:hypothetical protein